MKTNKKDLLILLTICSTVTFIGITGILVELLSQFFNSSIGQFFIKLFSIIDIILFITSFVCCKKLYNLFRNQGKNQSKILESSSSVNTAGLKVPGETIISKNQIIKRDMIPNETKELLWIKGESITNEHNLIKEPSLIDMDLEVKPTFNDLTDETGYYPNYRNLKPENRYIYLNWLRDITEPIPIGYVFIFYYGLERHLLFGKFEQAFDMIIKLRNYHNNDSFYAYSADALLIAALYHKRPDLISKIDLNKSSSKLSQFVIASLTGKIESDLLIKNCREVGFTNQRYIKSDYKLFKQTIDEILNEKFGQSSYPISEKDFLDCRGTFPLVLANYSLKLGERIANAPDISTNKKYQQNVFDILNEAHERVKANKRNEYAENKRPKSNCDGCPKQGHCEYGYVIYDEITKERLTLSDKFMMLHAFDCNIPSDDFGTVATNEETHNKRLLLKLDKEVLCNTLNYLQEVKKTYLALGKCGRAYYNFMKMGGEIKLVKEAIKEYDSHQERAKKDNKVLEVGKTINLQDYAEVQREYDFVVKNLQYSTMPHENISFSYEEEVFFKALIKAMKENKLWDKEGLRLTRLADLTFNVNCHTCYIGKVNLRNKMFIQVQRGSTQVKSYSITGIEDFLDKIPAWIRYIKYCRRN